MIAYLETSVVMRIVLREPDALREWQDIEVGATSELTFVECARTLDRLRILRVIDDERLTLQKRKVADILGRLDIIPLEVPILRHAAAEMPAVVATLDAIHLVSALAFRARQPRDQRPLVFATHDEQLGAVAQRLNLDCVGLRRTA